MGKEDKKTNKYTNGRISRMTKIKVATFKKQKKIKYNPYQTGHGVIETAKDKERRRNSKVNQKEKQKWKEEI